MDGRYSWGQGSWSCGGWQRWRDIGGCRRLVLQVFQIIIKIEIIALVIGHCFVMLGIGRWEEAALALTILSYPPIGGDLFRDRDDVPGSNGQLVRGFSGVFE